MDRTLVEDLRRTLESLKEKSEQGGGERARAALNDALTELETLEERFTRSLDTQVQQLRSSAAQQGELWTRRESILQARVCALRTALRRKQQEMERLLERSLDLRAREQAHVVQARKLAEKQQAERRSNKDQLLGILRWGIQQLQAESGKDDRELRDNAAVLKHFRFSEDTNLRLRAQLLWKEEEKERRSRSWSAEKERLQKILERSEELRFRRTLIIAEFLQRVKKEEEEKKSESSPTSRQEQTEDTKKQKSKKKSFWRR